MNVNGEKVWVPATRRDLIAGLRRMGVARIGNQPLSRAPKRALAREYCRRRAAEVRMQQQQVRHRREQTTFNQSFVAWSAKD